MESPVPVFVIHADLGDQRGKLTALNLCDAINDITPGQVLGSQFYNGIWSILLKSTDARSAIVDQKTIEIDNVTIELHGYYPTTKPAPNEKVIFKDLPFWVSDGEILKFLKTQPGITIKSGVIHARLRGYNSKLTQYFSGDRFVFIKGHSQRALHNMAVINYNRCRVWHKSQDDACRRCRNYGHTYTDTDACPAYREDPSVVTIRSSNCILSNFHMCTIKLWNQTFCSSEHAYQWRFMKYIGMDELADEILEAQTPAEAKAIASRVPRHLHHDWHTLKLNIMKIILHAKADCYEPFRVTLLKSVGRRLVESTKDVFWACGLTPHDTTTTIPEYYPGHNKLGAILEQVRSELVEEENQMARISTDAPDAVDGTTMTTVEDLRPIDQPVASTSGCTGGNMTPSTQDPAPVATSKPTTKKQCPQETEQSKTEKDTLDDSSAFSVLTTNPHCMSDSETDGEDTNDITMSGIEELPDNSIDSPAAESPQRNNDADEAREQESPVVEELPKPQPRRKLALKKPEVAVPPKQTITSMFNAMKRKITPGKDADISRDNLKVQRGETSKS